MEKITISIPMDQALRADLAAKLTIAAAVALPASKDSESAIGVAFHLYSLIAQKLDQINASGAQQ